jgi:hypothetical protein
MGDMKVLNRAVLLIAGAAIAIVSSPRGASACSCMPGGPPCQAYFETDAVFTGTVTAIAIRKMPIEAIPDQLFDRRFVQISIERIGKGVQGAGVEVRTGTGGGDCGFDFKVGQRYVVYASRGKDGSLTTGICSRTRALSDAAEDVAFFSALPAGGSGARVSGTITHWENDPASRRTLAYGGVADVQVLVRGSAGVFSAMTDAEGRYAISGVPPGKYETQVLPPSEFSTRHLSGTFEIGDPRACRVEDFSLHFAGRVAGTVLDASGRPVPDTRVEIAPAAALDEPLYLDYSLSRTDANGQFELGDIPPGSYVVGIGLTSEMDPKTVYRRTLLPPIEVGQGNRVEAGVIRLPQPSRRYELRGVAVDAAGVPIARASVHLQGARYRQVTTPVSTAADGTFVLPVFEGQSYTVRALVTLPGEPRRQAQAAQVVTISGDPAPIRLVLVVR